MAPKQDEEILQHSQAARVFQTGCSSLNFLRSLCRTASKLLDFSLIRSNKQSLGPQASLDPGQSLGP